MLFAQYGQVLLAIHERSSRILLLTRQAGKAAEPIARSLVSGLQTLPEALRRSISFDNGTEFAQHSIQHSILRRQLGIATFFCDTHSPWQKGGIENAIGRLRRALPRKTNLDSLSQTTLDSLVAQYNNTPRKCLGFRTPAETFKAALEPLHFKCESTSPPPRE